MDYVLIPEEKMRQSNVRHPAQHSTDDMVGTHANVVSPLGTGPALDTRASSLL